MEKFGRGMRWEPYLNGWSLENGHVKYWRRFLLNVITWWFTTILLGTTIFILNFTQVFSTFNLPILYSNFFFCKPNPKINSLHYCHAHISTPLPTQSLTFLSCNQSKAHNRNSFYYHAHTNKNWVPHINVI
jgi:hypothetical protein